MVYPKALMTTKEMVAMGFSDRQMRAAARHPLAYHYLIKTPAGKRYRWDTEQFEKYRRSVMR